MFKLKCVPIKPDQMHLNISRICHVKVVFGFFSESHGGSGLLYIQIRLYYLISGQNLKKKITKNTPKNHGALMGDSQDIGLQ